MFTLATWCQKWDPMAFQLSLPEPFDTKRVEEWKSWLKRFERYRVASGLIEKNEKTQVNMLLYLLGEKGDDILTSFSLTEDELKQYNTIIKKLATILMPEPV